jgi:hypothetical protein
MPRDQDGISRAGDRTGRWRGRLRADWRSEGTKFGGAQCAPPNPHRLLCRTRPARPKRQDAVLFCLLRARHARREMGSDHPARPSTPLIVALFACSVVFLHRIRSFTVERISKTIRKESLPLCLPVQKEKEKEFATHHAWSPRRTYVFRAPRPAWKLCFFFYSMKVPWKVCGRAPLIITPESLSPPGAPALFVRPALLCRSLCPPTNPPTHAGMAHPFWLGST